MAGVASGLALATTLMAMQVADSMSVRTCPYSRVVDVQTVDVRPDHGFLGIRYVVHNGVAEVDSVIPGTPAEAVSLRAGDKIIAIDGRRVTSDKDVQRIYDSHPGAQPTLIIERDGAMATVQPTLAAWPIVSY